MSIPNPDILSQGRLLAFPLALLAGVIASPESVLCRLVSIGSSGLLWSERERWVLRDRGKRTITDFQEFRRTCVWRCRRDDDAWSCSRPGWTHCRTTRFGSTLRRRSRSPCDGTSPSRVGSVADYLSGHRKWIAWSIRRGSSAGTGVDSLRNARFSFGTVICRLQRQYYFRRYSVALVRHWLGCSDGAHWHSSGTTHGKAGEGGLQALDGANQRCGTVDNWTVSYLAGMTQYDWLAGEDPRQLT